MSLSDGFCQFEMKVASSAFIIASLFKFLSMAVDSKKKALDIVDYVIIKDRLYEHISNSS